ncbi:MAG: LPS-assembly protein LptD [Pseudomonadales bacterium]|jgi:LPS-assembly protein|nr:LPS-assembly protein LptD [Pseudomonadales bacterium]MCP5321983.1 LPS-assembly protein LptD [Pseudomonadales bacterium]
MQSKPFLILCCAIAGLGALAAPCVNAGNGEWQCRAGADGNWDCVSVTPAGTPSSASTAARPAQAPRQPVATGADARAQSMDWVSIENLTPEQRSAISAQCHGAYVEPPVGAAERGETVFGSIRAYAAESELRQNPETANFSGDVTLSLDSRQMRADRASYSRAEDRIDISGNVQYREPGLLLRGDSASIEAARNAGEIRAARFVMHAEHARGEAELVQRNSDGSIDLSETVYTRCEPGRDDWQLAADALHLDRATGQATARNARLEVGGVPVLYTPYLRFPIDDRRMSGLLWPTITNSTRNGFDITVPYYFNLAPNYDATLVSRYTSRRGMLLGGEVRYLNRWSEWSASGSYLHNDDTADRERWISGIEHAGTPMPGMLTRISYAKASDRLYLRDLSSTGLDVKRSTHLEQMGELSYRVGERWLVGATVQQYQVLDPELAEPYRMRPRLQAERAAGGEPFVVDYGLISEMTVFDHPDPTALTGERLYLEPRITYPLEWAALFVRPMLGYQMIRYRLDEKAYGSDSPSAAAPMASLDVGYFLERDTRMFGRSFLQTLEPRLYYLRVGYDSQNDVPNFDSSDLTFSFNQLFRNTRFSGHDRIADANQLSLSLSSRLIDEASGRELLTASVGQILYFEDRRVTVCDGSIRTYDKPGCRSPQTLPGPLPWHGQTVADPSASSSQIAAEVQVQPSQALWLSATTLLDTGSSRINEGGVLMHWIPAEDTVLNFGYRYRREQHSFDAAGRAIDENIDQADVSAALPVADNWRVFARYQYDITNNQNLESLAGLEYSACCWTVRMVYQEGLDWYKGRDAGFYLQFVLRGLGGLGKDIDQLLQRSIFNFGERRGAGGFAY